MPHAHADPFYSLAKTLLHAFVQFDKFAYCEDTSGSQIAKFPMHVISRKTLREAERKHGDLIVPLAVWFKVAKAAHWKNIEDVRKTYASADPVGRYTVFNIKGNSYRLIVKIEYAKGRVYIRAVQTHAEYDKGAWNQ